MKLAAHLRRSYVIRSPANSLALALLFLTLFIPTAVLAKDEYYRHTFFDNNLTSDSYFYSPAAAIAPSRLEQKNSRLPVETATFLLGGKASCPTRKSVKCSRNSRWKHGSNKPKQ